MSTVRPALAGMFLGAPNPGDPWNTIRKFFTQTVPQAFRRGLDRYLDAQLEGYQMEIQSSHSYCEEKWRNKQVACYEVKPTGSKSDFCQECIKVCEEFKRQMRALDHI